MVILHSHLAMGGRTGQTLKLGGFFMGGEASERPGNRNERTEKFGGRLDLTTVDALSFSLLQELLETW